MHKQVKNAAFEIRLSHPWFTLVPTRFGTRKLLCLLELLLFGSPFLLFFANKLTKYSIIVDKGVICFGSKYDWDNDLDVRVHLGWRLFESRHAF